MPDKETAIPPSARPEPGELDFDLDQVLASILGVRTEIPPDAFTAQILGTERAGSGVVIDEKGLVLTIGYLITEAETIWLTTGTGNAVPGHVVGYDQATGFGLVQALGRLGLPAARLGTIEPLQVADPVIVAGHGGREQALSAKIAGKREFAGYWEYLLDEAIFTAPAHPNWGGAACLDQSGLLCGIGSLFIQHEQGERTQMNANMIVPIDLLPPVLDDLLRFGRVNRPARPWLGMYTADTQHSPVVVGLATGSPADEAGVHVGDVVLEVDERRVSDLASMLREIWRLGPAGVDVPLTLAREGRATRLVVRSADRNSFLKQPRLH
jgi:S1-C subfamily serine protease